MEKVLQSGKYKRATARKTDERFHARALLEISARKERLTDISLTLNMTKINAPRYTARSPHFGTVTLSFRGLPGNQTFRRNSS